MLYDMSSMPPIPGGKKGSSVGGGSWIFDVVRESVIAAAVRVKLVSK